VGDDPFGALGLPARADLSDEDVRAAWRRIAAATHPDLEDGGDPGRFGAAAAAYDALRTSFGRGEALADLGLAGSGPPAAQRTARPGARHARRAGAPGPGASGQRRRLGVPGPGASGRRRRLALRACAVAGVTAAALLAAGWTPATVGLLAGALTWAAVTSRPDLPGGTLTSATRGTGRWRRGGPGR
jgi:curved DNA-binding protein CbpA